MIEANKYTNETIHVANWLLGTGEAARLLELARLDAEVNPETYPEEVDERVRRYLGFRIDDRFTEAYGECFPNSLAGRCARRVEEIEGVWKFPVWYEDLGDGAPSNEDLIRPFVGQALAGLCLEDVAEIILEHVHESILERIMAAA